MGEGESILIHRQHAPLCQCPLRPFRRLHMRSASFACGRPSPAPGLQHTPVSFTLPYSMVRLT